MGWCATRYLWLTSIGGRSMPFPDYVNKFVQFRIDRFNWAVNTLSLAPSIFPADWDVCDESIVSYGIYSFAHILDVFHSTGYIFYGNADIKLLIPTILIIFLFPEEQMQFPFKNGFKLVHSTMYNAYRIFKNCHLKAIWNKKSCCDQCPSCRPAKNTLRCHFW